MGPLETRIRLLKRALKAGDISKDDYAFEVSLAKRFAASGDLTVVESLKPKPKASAIDPTLVEVEFDAMIRETPKAWLLLTSEFGKKWVPKSRCELGASEVVMPSWLYNKWLEEKENEG